jgi:hypothetical protein
VSYARNLDGSRLSYRPSYSTHNSPPILIRVSEWKCWKQLRTDVHSLQGTLRKELSFCGCYTQGWSHLFFPKKPTQFKPRVATPLLGFSVRVPARLGANATGWLEISFHFTAAILSSFSNDLNRLHVTTYTGRRIIKKYQTSWIFYNKRNLNSIYRDNVELRSNIRSQSNNSNS